MITIRIVDHVEGRVLSREVDGIAAGVALLASLFSRPEFDPWAAAYPVADEEPADIGVRCVTSDDGEDMLVIIQRGHEGDGKPQGLLS